VSAKVACLIPARWDLQDYALHTCSDRSHIHLSKSEFEDNLENKLIEILRPPDSRRGRKAVVRIIRTMTARGLSCSVGEGLATALRTDSERDWALTMLAQIRGRREAITPEPLELSALFGAAVL
jgi:hypothetical protein